MSKVRMVSDVGMHAVPMPDTATAEIVHASPKMGALPLCAQNDGQIPPSGSLIYNLTGPSKGAHSDKVNCQGCLEWMHA